MMRKNLIVIEETGTGFSAYSPDLDGCVTTCHSREEVERDLQEARAFHPDGLRLEGMKAPDPHTYSTYVEVPA